MRNRKFDGKLDSNIIDDLILENFETFFDVMLK